MIFSNEAGLIGIRIFKQKLLGMQGNSGEIFTFLLQRQHLAERSAEIKSDQRQISRLGWKNSRGGTQKNARGRVNTKGVSAQHVNERSPRKYCELHAKTETSGWTQ